MKMPVLIPLNHKEIYQYFREFDYNFRIQDFGFALMHLLFRSEIHFRDHAEQQIQHHLEHGGSVILSANHQSYADVPTLAAIVYVDAFKLVRRNIIIPAKAELFRWPVIGKFIRHMQAHPTFRSRDFSRDEQGALLRRQVTDDLIQLNIDYINQKGNVAIFPESTRKRGNQPDIQSIKTGIARIATGVDDPSRLLIVPLGFAYKSNFPIKHKPLMVVGEPVSPKDKQQDELLDEIQAAMQSVVTEASERVARIRG